MVVEIASTRVLSPYLGTTIFIWAAVIAFVLGALSLGYYIGGLLADRYQNKKQLSYILLMAAIGTLIIPFLGKIIGESTLELPLAIASVISATILVPASIFYGMVSPFAIKLVSEKNKEGKSAGAIFAISTLGSIAGALVTAFILIPNIQVSHIFILATALMLVAALLIRRKALERQYLAICIIISILTITTSYSLPVSGNIVASFDSEYQHITIVDIMYNKENIRWLILDNFYSSGEKRENNEPAFEYVKTNRLGYELIANPKKALIIGVAGGTQVEDLKRTFPNLTVYGVDIDKKAVETGKIFLSLKEDNRTNIIINDARRYLKTTEIEFDVTIIDVYRGKANIPYHLVSREFVSELKLRLKQDGVVVINLISKIENKEMNTFKLIYNTYKAEFRNLVAIPTKKEKLDEVQNIIIIASDRNLTDFKEKHKEEIYEPQIDDDRIITDEWNPAELFVIR